MSHIVNPSLYRIGKNIHWNVLYSSNYKSTGMRLNLILNLTLLSIFRMLNFRVIKIFINVENYKFKLFVAGFRLTKLHRLSTDINDSVMLLKHGRAFMYPPVYFGGSHGERDTMISKFPHFAFFMKDVVVKDNKKSEILDSFGFLSDFEHNFTKNLVFINKWSAQGAFYDKKKLAPLLLYALSIRSELKIIEGRKLTPLLLKNAKAFYFLIFKKIFILAAEGLKVLKKFGLKKWYKIFKKSIKILLKRLLKSNILFFKNNVNKLNPYSIFSKFCLMTLKTKGVNFPFMSNSLKKNVVALRADYVDHLKILKLIVWFKNQKNKSVFALKLFALLLIKIVIKSVIQDYAWFPLKALPVKTFKFKHASFDAKINDIASQSRAAGRDLKKKNFSNELRVSKKSFFSWLNYCVVRQLKKRSNAPINFGQLRLSVVESNFQKNEIHVRHKKIVLGLRKKKRSLFSLRTYFYLVWAVFENNNNFYNWIFKKKIYLKNAKAPVISDWLTDKLFIMDLNVKLSQVFSLNIQLNLFTFKDLLGSFHSYSFFKNIKNYLGRVFIAKKDKVEQKMGLILAHFALYFKSPHVLTAFIAEAIQFRTDHFRFVRPFSMLLGLLKLNDYNLSGLKIGFYGRLNGRDRKFRYYIIKGCKPNLLSLERNNLDYAELQSITRYGVVHIHVWMYN